MTRRVLLPIAIPFAVVAVVHLGLTFFAEQTLEELRQLGTRAHRNTDVLKDGAQQLERCLDRGGVECELVTDALKPRLLILAARQELLKPHPDRRRVRELLAQTWLTEEALKRAQWVGNLGIRLGWWPEKHGPSLQAQYDVPAILELTKRAKVERAKPKPDLAVLEAIRGELRSLVGKATAGERQFDAELAGAAVSARRMLYLIVGVMTLAMFGIAAWIANRMLRTIELKERQLKRRDESYRLAVEAADLGAWQWEPATGQVVATERCKALLGLPPQADLNYRTFLDVVHPDDRVRMNDAVTHALKLRRGYEVEYRVVCRDGNERWLRGAGRPDHTNDGEAPRVQGIIQDITERRRAEEDVARLAGIVESSDDAIIGKTSEGIITSWNSGAERIYGFTKDEALGRPMTMLVPPERHAELSQILDLIRRGESVQHFEAERLRKDGQSVFLSLTISPIKDGTGRIVGASTIARDITERKRAEQELHKQRQWLQVTLNSIGDAVLATNASGRITFLNPVAGGLTGWTEEQAFGQPAGDVFRIIDEQTREKSEDIIGRVLREACAVSLANHTALLDRDGREIPIEDSAAPIRDSDGNMIGVVLVFHDVTEKRRAHEALRESENQFRTLADAIPQLCWTANADGWITWYNRRWYEYTGTTPEQMEGWGWQSVHDPKALPQVLEQWRASIATGKPFDMVFPLRGADSVFRPFLTRVMPVFDREGKVLRWFGTNTDISEQQKTERALRESEARLAFALEVNHTGHWDLDLVDHSAHRSLQHDRIFGYPELLPEWTYEMFLDHVLPEDREMVDQGFRAAIETKGNWSFECRIVRTDGAIRWILASGQHRLDETGTARHMVGIVQDITERKEAEVRLRQSQKLESVGQLAGGIAHDFNNLLVGVIGNASLAKSMLPDDHTIAGLLDHIVKAGEQAAHLTRQMLAYAGKGRFLIEPLDLSELVPEMSLLVQPSIPKKIDVHLELEHRLPPIQADRGQVQQVFMNLVLNGAEAIGSNAGRISVKTGLREVGDGDQPDLSPGKYVYLEVSDTGCGMEEATKARIFDPFFSTKFLGRGLGLAAVGGIVRGHKGAITVESAPGKGTTFTVLFPVPDDAAAVSPVAARKENLVGSGTVLVVDDEDIVRQVAKCTLELYGYHVLLANNGLAAIDIFKRHPGDIALVVLDLSMPGMGGEEALLELRKIRPRVKVLAASGYSEEEMMRLFAGQRVSGFLPKPFTATRLAEKVKEVLG